MEITAFQASDYNSRWYVTALLFVKMFKYLVSSSVLLKSCAQVWLYTITYIVQAFRLMSQEFCMPLNH